MSTPPLSNIQAILMAFLGFTLWTGSDAIIRYLNDYDTASVAFLSGATATGLAVIFSPFLGGIRASFAKPELPLRLIRGCIIAICGFFAVIAFANLELATAYAIIFVTPLLSKIISIFLTGEKIEPRAWLISLLGFMGVLVVVRPGMVTIGIGSLAALACSALFAVGFVLGRRINRDNQTLFSMTFFQYFFMALGCLIIGPNDIWDMTMIEIILGMCVGAFGFLGALLVSNAYASAPTAYVAPVHYIQIIWGVILGAVLFSEYPDIYTIIGGSIIVGAGLLLIKYSR